MAPVAYSGALQPKKKSDLQEIAVALNISDSGTKEDLQARIKKHLDNNPDLEEDPKFAGLFGRRKRSVQPTAAPTSRPPRSSTRGAALEPVNEPTKEEEDELESSSEVEPASAKVTATPSKSPFRREASLDLGTPSSLPPLPPSPAKSIIEATTNAAKEVQQAVAQRLQAQELIPQGTEYLYATRAFLSNSRNIWTLTSVFELLYILTNVIPFKDFELPLAGPSAKPLTVPYPPLSTFQTSTFWIVLLHWAVPTLLAPSLVGNLISFSPQPPAPPPSSSSQLAEPAPIVFDNLTAAIVRLAASISYPYASLSLSSGVVGLDVLGYNLRVFNASIGLAFAFAEAIQGAPRTFAKTLISEHRLRIERAATPAPLGENRALMEAGAEEVD